MKSTRDPRAAFKSRTDAELAAELDGLTTRQQHLAQDVARLRPTRDEVEAKIVAAQARAESYLAAHAARALDAVTNARPDALGFRDAEKAATFAVLASDEFADRLREHVASKRSSEAEVMPKREELDSVRQRIDAIAAEQDLRELDDEDERQAAERAALVERLKTGG